MTTNPCPTCASPIDPARTPVARVRGTKIVTFCSVRCADASAVEAAAIASELAREPENKPEVVALEKIAQPPPREFTPPRPRGNRRRKIIALSAIIMVGGMAITIINAVSPSSSSDVRAAEKNPRSGSPDDDVEALAERKTPGESTTVATAAKTGDPEAPEAPETPLAKAKERLGQLMGSPSLRIQKIAALALSRINDADALALLDQLLEREDQELRKVDLAYALARSGDVHAQKLLRRRLKHSHRDVRVDAARALVKLGDDSGSKVLRHVLSLRSHRLGAAGLLARLGDKSGFKALRKELSSPKASEESRMRAVVALGRAGDSSVRDRLVAMLEDRRYQVGAADALAALGDHVALDALKKQLALPSLRVRAALALRRLGAEGDIEDELVRLTAALDSGSDTNRVSAAEAILILTGPRKVAEFD